MPPLPAIIPANLHNTLSAIRSSIFLTTHNPTNARLGNKYLKKPLIGKKLVDYYPKPLPKVSTLNKEHKNWLATMERSFLKKGGDPRALAEWKAMSVAPGYQAVGQSLKAWGSEGPFWDGENDRRLRKIARLKRIGKGAPKKGMGKQAQMGKKR